MNRAQSDSIGVILLVAVISLTITTTGVVVLTEWQSGIDQGPVASIDSEITPINVTLGHRGGDVLYPQNTTIHLIGADEEISLDEPLEPGTSLSREFDRLDGTIELLVVYDPR